MSLHNNKKSEVMKAIMLNKGSTTLFREALKSPLGSTSRTKAQKVFRIMNKLQGNYDGVGGPGLNSLPYSKPTQNINPPVEISRPQNMVVFHKLPAMDLFYGKRPPSTLDGKGGLFDGKTGLFDGFLGDVGGFIKGPQTPEPTPTTTPVTPPTSAAAPTGAFLQAPSTLYAPTAAPPTPPKTSFVYPSYVPPETPKTIPTTNPITSITPDIPEPLKFESSPSSKLPREEKGFRTTRHNNPTAFTTDIAEQANLIKGVDYTQGDQFTGNDGRTYYTAQIIGDPIKQTIKVIDSIGFYTDEGKPRWDYLNKIPEFQNWDQMNPDQKEVLINKMKAIENTAGSSVAEIGDLSSVQKAVSESIGPNLFAFRELLKDNPITGGKSFGQAIADNQTTIWDRYKLGGIQEDVDRLRFNQATLPATLAAFVRGKDENLVKIDALIKTHLDEASDKMDMSDPLNQTKSKDYLNYLYVLRGEQNQRYISYVNNSIDEHQALLDSTIDLYNTSLTNYETALNSANLITQDTYNQYATALAGMYTSVSEAPTKAAQLYLLKEQGLLVHAQRVTEGIEQVDQWTYLETYEELKEHVIDKKGFIIPEVGLVDAIHEFAESNPEMTSAALTRVYAAGIDRVIYAGSSTKDQDGEIVTHDRKVDAAKNGIQQFLDYAQLSGSGGETRPETLNDIDTFNLGMSYAEDMKSGLAHVLAEKYSEPSLAQDLRSVLAELGKGVGFVTKNPMTEEQFYKKIEDKTSLAASVARAIWAARQRYEGEVEEFVRGSLFNENSTDTRGQNIAWTDAEFGQKIGNMVAQSYYNLQITDDLRYLQSLIQ